MLVAYTFPLSLGISFIAALILAVGWAGSSLAPATCIGTNYTTQKWSGVGRCNSSSQFGCAIPLYRAAMYVNVIGVHDNLLFAADFLYETETYALSVIASLYAIGKTFPCSYDKRDFSVYKRSNTEFACFVASMVLFGLSGAICIFSAIYCYKSREPREVMRERYDLIIYPECRHLIDIGKHYSNHLYCITAMQNREQLRKCVTIILGARRCHDLNKDVCKMIARCAWSLRLGEKSKWPRSPRLTL